MHFKFKKIFRVNVLRSLKAIQNCETDIAVGVCFYVLNIQSLSDFVGHVVAPVCTRCDGNNGSSKNGTEAETTNGYAKICHDVKSHANQLRSRSAVDRHERKQRLASK